MGVGEPRAPGLPCKTGGHERRRPLRVLLGSPLHGCRRSPGSPGAEPPGLAGSCRLSSNATARRGQSLSLGDAAAPACQRKRRSREGLLVSMQTSTVASRLKRKTTWSRASTSQVLTIALRLEDPLVVIVLRLVYTSAVMVLIIWLLRTGNPVGGLLLVPAAAVWLRREAESGRLAARVRRALRQ